MVNINNYSKEQLEELAFTDEEKKQLEEARKMPITFDTDCPETTPDRAIEFKRANPTYRRAVAM